jgi:hypothetical protein
MLQRGQNKTKWKKKVAKLESQDEGNQKAPPKKSKSKEGTHNLAMMLAKWVHARGNIRDSSNFIVLKKKLLLLLELL